MAIDYHCFLTLENSKTAPITHALPSGPQREGRAQADQPHTGPETGGLGVAAVHRQLPNLLTGEGLSVLTTKPFTATPHRPGHLVSWAQPHSVKEQGTQGRDQEQGTGERRGKSAP